MAAQEKKPKKPGYKPSSLPPLLDLSNKNTKLQLSGQAAAGPVDPKKQSEDACRDVMQDHLKEWIEKDEEKLIDARSRECDMKAFWLWLRDFHKEYNENWYLHNMPRLKEQFMPTFKAVLKHLRQSSVPEPAADLLDMGSSAVPACASDSLLDVLSTDPASTAPSLPSATPSFPSSTLPSAQSHAVNALFSSQQAPISASNSTAANAPFSQPISATSNLAATPLDALFSSQQALISAAGNASAVPLNAPFSQQVPIAAAGNASAAPLNASAPARPVQGANADLLDFTSSSGLAPAETSSLLDM